MRICPCEFAEHEGPGDEPVWEPILEALGEELTGGFMYMFRARLDDERVIHAYKHHITRRYVFLDDDVQAYEWTRCGGYAPIRRDWAIERALFAWFVMAFFTDEDRVALLAAWERSHPRVADQ